MDLKDVPEVLFYVRKSIVTAKAEELKRLHFCEKIKTAEDLIKSAMEDLPFTEGIHL